jgi:hypothetical protein
MPLISRRYPVAKQTSRTASGWRTCGAHGLIERSFIPPEPIRDLRDLTRYRKFLIDERIREVNRLHKLLESANIKLASVATDVMGVSGKEMLEALLGAGADPEILAELAPGRLRRKIPALKQAPGRAVQAASPLLVENHSGSSRLSG